jgi:large subunit ribosomal protein L10
MTQVRKAAKLNTKKVDEVTLLKGKLGKTKALFLTEYRGLTHQQLEQLRRALKKVQAEYIVAKNSLMHIAMKEWNSAAAEKLKDGLKNPTATLLAMGDEVAAIKALSEFIKTAQLPKVKIGFFSGEVTKEEDFKKLATLPVRSQLLGMLVGQLNSPIQGLHYALNWNLQKLVTVLGNIKDKKPATQ